MRRARPSPHGRPDPASGLPVVVGFNLEPDQRVVPVDGTATWDGVDPLIALVEAWRADDPDRRVTWLWRCDPQIAVAHGDPGWALDRWADQIATSRRRGDTVGIHTHFWRWSEPLATFVHDAADAGWKTECLERSVAAFTRVVGTAPTACQIGDTHMDPAILAAYVALGISLDLTVEPGAAEKATMVHTEFVTGTMPDRTRSPRVPYRPRRDDPLRAARRRPAPVAMVPVTTSTVPLVVDGVVVDPVGTAANLGLEPVRFRHVVTGGLAASARAGVPYVHLIVRSDVGTHPAQAEHVARNLEWLATGMRGLAEPWGGVRFVTPEQLRTETLGGPARAA